MSTIPPPSDEDLKRDAEADYAHIASLIPEDWTKVWIRRAVAERQRAESAERCYKENESAHLDLLAKWDSLSELERLAHAKAYHLLLAGFGSLAESRDKLKHESRQLKERVEAAERIANDAGKLLTATLDKLKNAERERDEARRAVLFGRDADSFDWAVLGKIDEQEERIAELEAANLKLAGDNELMRLAMEQRNNELLRMCKI